MSSDIAPGGSLIFAMTSQAHAIEAVDLLRAAGHPDASHAPRRAAIREHIIIVSTDTPGAAFEVQRLVRAVDADAQRADFAS